jgi:hypothetical protein
LYYYALYNTSGNEAYGLKVRTYLKELIDEMLLEQVSIFPSVMALAILEDVRKKGFIAPDAENKIILLDEFLFRKVMDLLQSGPVESWDAIIGILNYYSERTQSECIQYYQGQIITVVGQLFSPLWASGALPHRMNLGIIEGMTGLLLGLIKAASNPEADEAAMEIVREGILYILSYRREGSYAENRYNIFPDYVPADQNKASYSNQLSWCNSDLTRSLLFYRAFALFKDEELRKMADLVGLNTLLRKDLPYTDITDSHFYRGARREWHKPTKHCMNSVIIKLTWTAIITGSITRKKCWKENWNAISTMGKRLIFYTDLPELRLR